MDQIVETNNKKSPLNNQKILKNIVNLKNPLPGANRVTSVEG